MSDGAALIYVYDGSFDGFLCCAWRALQLGEEPCEILLASEAPLSLFEVREVVTEEALARRMQGRIRQRMGERALALVKRSFLACLEQKEVHMLEFLRLGRCFGQRAVDMATHPSVQCLLKAVRHLVNEAEAYRGFVRFSELGGALVSVIEPKNQVLPLICSHFSNRFPDEVLVIYDKTHASVLLSDRGKVHIGYLEEFTPVLPDRRERNYRALWQSFYDAISIRQRVNPRCRMSHMPRRYWQQLTEFWERERYLPEEGTGTRPEASPMRLSEGDRAAPLPGEASAGLPG